MKSNEICEFELVISNEMIECQVKFVIPYELKPNQMKFVSLKCQKYFPNDCITASQEFIIYDSM